jgi:hypothetical protein
MEMSKKTPPKISGRAVQDEKGNQTWVWHADEAVDTAVVRALGEGLSLDGAPGANPAAGSNPYDRTNAAQPSPPGSPDEAGVKRRTLDDMRKLSEAIKRAKQNTRD